MRFYCITDKSQQTTNQLLERACNDRDIEYRVVDDSMICSETNDLLYRVLDGSHGNVLPIEDSLISSGGISFYINYRSFIKKYDRSADYDSTLIPIPSSNKLAELSSSINKASLNYPVIVKILGGSHGVGLIRIDSYVSLLGILDFLDSTHSKYVIKEYVPGGTSARLIVLGDRVIGEIEYYSNQDDFRSNAGLVPNVRKKEYTKEVHDIAIRAVKALGLEFGGVDILISERGPLVAEVNFPCFFPRVQNLTGIDIAGQMIDYLVEKSRRIN